MDQLVTDLYIPIIQSISSLNFFKPRIHNKKEMDYKTKVQNGYMHFYHILKVKKM